MYEVVNINYPAVAGFLKFLGPELIWDFVFKLLTTIIT